MKTGKLNFLRDKMKSKNPNYEIMGRWFVPTLGWAPVLYWDMNKVIKSLNNDGSDYMLTLSGFWINPKSARQKIDMKVNYALKNNDFTIFESFMKETEKIFAELLSLKKRLDKYNENDYTKAIEDFFKGYTDLESPWIASILIGDALQPKIMADAKAQGLDEFEVIRFLNPIRKTLSVEQKEEMHEIKKKIVKNKLMSKIESINYIKDKNTKL